MKFALSGVLSQQQSGIMPAKKSGKNISVKYKHLPFRSFSSQDESIKTKNQRRGGCPLVFVPFLFEPDRSITVDDRPLVLNCQDSYFYLVVPHIARYNRIIDNL